jgi:hypothetical protein
MLPAIVSCLIKVQFTSGMVGVPTNSLIEVYQCINKSLEHPPYEVFGNEFMYFSARASRICIKHCLLGSFLVVRNELIKATVGLEACISVV